MTSSYTANLGLQQPATGDQTNSWGTTVNTDWTIVDNAIAGLASINLPAQSGYPTIVLTFSQGSPTQQLPNRRLIFTGALTANTLVLLPQGRNFEIAVTNGTSGAFSLTLGVSNGAEGALGSTVAVAQGATMELFSDGTNIGVRAVTGPSSVAAAGNVAAFADQTGGALQTRDSRPPRRPRWCRAELTWNLRHDATKRLPARERAGGLEDNPCDAVDTAAPPTAPGTGPRRSRAGQARPRRAGYDPSNATGRLTGSTGEGASAAALGNSGVSKPHADERGARKPLHTATSISSSNSSSTVTDPGDAHVLGNSTPGGTTFPEISASAQGTGDNNTGSATTGISVSTSTTTTTSTTNTDTGGGSAFNVVQPTIILNYIIKT